MKPWTGPIGAAVRAVLVLATLLVALPVFGGPAEEFGGRPDVLIVTVDTLRADRLSGYGYDRPTTPNIDRLMESGVRFADARTVEPLTAPALCSMLTSLYPHDHGATRNGLRMRAGLDSLPKRLQSHGYRTAAFVGNWTLRDKLSGLDEHFEEYEPVLTRKRWFGLLRREATAEDLNRQSLAWLAEHRRRHSDRPFFLWVHYTEPHAPYRKHEQFVESLGLQNGDLDASDRYDTEVAFVDAAIGKLLDDAKEYIDPEHTIVVFAADHGESLGEHGYWGHGRHLYEPGLQVPMAIAWPGRIEPAVIDAPALLIDLPPTLLTLAGLTTPEEYRGIDWAHVQSGAEPQPFDRVTFYEAHKGAVISNHDSEMARKAGLLELGMIEGGRKEILRVEKQRRWVFELKTDPRELNDLHDVARKLHPGLEGWMQVVYRGLDSFEDVPPEELDDEAIEHLRSLGYVD